jgi:hypothetical protein
VHLLAEAWPRPADSALRLLTPHPQGGGGSLPAQFDPRLAAAAGTGGQGRAPGDRAAEGQLAESLEELRVGSGGKRGRAPAAAPAAGGTGPGGGVSARGSNTDSGGDGEPPPRPASATMLYHLESEARLGGGGLLALGSQHSATPHPGCFAPRQPRPPRCLLASSPPPPPCLTRPPGRGRHAPRFRVRDDHDQATAPSHHRLEGTALHDDDGGAGPGGAAAAGQPPLPAQGPQREGSFGTITTGVSGSPASSGGLLAAPPPQQQRGASRAARPPPQQPGPAGASIGGSLDAAVAAIAFAEADAALAGAGAGDSLFLSLPGAPSAALQAPPPASTAANGGQRALVRAESDSFKRLLAHTIGLQDDPADAVGSPGAEEAELLAWINEPSPDRAASLRAQPS